LIGLVNGTNNTLHENNSNQQESAKQKGIYFFQLHLINSAAYSETF